MITWKKELGLIPLQIISECYMYFHQFSKIMKFQKNVTDKNTKFSAKSVHCNPWFMLGPSNYVILGPRFMWYT